MQQWILHISGTQVKLQICYSDNCQKHGVERLYKVIVMGFRLHPKNWDWVPSLAILLLKAFYQHVLLNSFFSLHFFLYVSF